MNHDNIDDSKIQEELEGRSTAAALSQMMRSAADGKMNTLRCCPIGKAWPAHTRLHPTHPH